MDRRILKRAGTGHGDAHLIKFNRCTDLCSLAGRIHRGRCSGCGRARLLRSTVRLVDALERRRAYPSASRRRIRGTRYVQPCSGPAGRHVRDAVSRSGCRGVSTIGRAASIDGVRFTRENTPLLVAEASYEKGGGVEDPRLTEVSGIWYSTYPSSTGRTLSSRSPPHETSVASIGAGSYAPRMPAAGTCTGRNPVPSSRPRGYWMYYMADAAGAYDQTGVAWSTDLLSWTEALDRPVLPRRSRAFDSRVVEPGPLRPDRRRYSADL